MTKIEQKQDIDIDALFGVGEIENPKMTKDEYITRARAFISKVNDLYWQNWGFRTLNDDELPDESQCEKCDDHCVIKLNDREYDCHPDHEGGVCRIRLFDEGNYSDEMGELLEEFNHMDLINPEVEFTELSSLKAEADTESIETDEPLYESVKRLKRDVLRKQKGWNFPNEIFIECDGMIKVCDQVLEWMEKYHNKQPKKAEAEKEVSECDHDRRYSEIEGYAYCKKCGKIME